MRADSSPKISVVILSYNFGAYIRECIDSVLNQTLGPYEVIICDDASLDGTRNILEQYARRYPDLIKLHIQGKNLGLPHHANFAFKQATGDLVSWIDGDDRWLPRKLELEWKALLEFPEARVAYSNVRIIDAGGRYKELWYDGKGPQPPSGDLFIPVFSRRIFPNTTSIFRNHLFYRACYDETGYFDMDLESLWDWDEKIRFALRYSIAYSGEAQVEYRQHPESFSRHSHDKGLRAMINIYEKYRPHLSSRTQEDKTLVQIRIESLIATRQAKIHSHLADEKYSCLTVHGRNQRLLRDLSPAARSLMRKESGDLLGAAESVAAKEFLSMSSKWRLIKQLIKSVLSQRNNRRGDEV